MKKSIICIVTLLLLILGYCVFELVYLKNGQTQVNMMVEKVKEEKGDVKTQVTRLSVYLKKRESFLPLFVSREKVESIICLQNKMDYYVSINELQKAKECAVEIGCLYGQLIL